MIKEELRKIYKAQRKEISAQHKMKLDDLLLLEFQKFDYASVQTVLSYWPIKGQAEPDTHLFTRYLTHFLPEINLAYPVMNMVTMQMVAIRVDDTTAYQTNQWGITEPIGGMLIEPHKIDMILVPLLVCDKKGHRVGYGKGFYDRYLAQCREDTVKMGFSYFPAVEKISDTHQFDVPLTYCITPRQIYEF
jgi:5-formyltetrahydrofolate cyclo-ligase